MVTVESVQNYIDGSADVVPKLPDHLAGVERYSSVNHNHFLICVHKLLYHRYNYGEEVGVC